MSLLVDYLPNVTREDVLRVVKRDFDARDQEEVLRLLGEYNQGAGRNVLRVQLAIVKLSDRSIEGVRKQLDVAKADFRDVIAPAEYPEFSRIGFVGVDKMTRHERESLKARDWRQYENWLTRE